MSYENISADSVRNNKGKIAYSLAKKVPVSNNSMGYLNKVNNIFNELDLDELQCKSTMKLFKNVVIRSGEFTHLGNYENIEGVQGNEILFVVVPSIPTFHAFVVVINIDKTRVDIYQSNGRNVRLFKTTLTFKDFKSYFNNLIDLHSRVKNMAVRDLEILSLDALEVIFDEFVVLEQKLFNYDRRNELNATLTRLLQTEVDNEDEPTPIDELKQEVIISILKVSHSEIEISVYISKPSKVSRSESSIIKIQKIIRGNITRRKLKH